MLLTRILALLCAAIFFGEIAVMFVLDFLSMENTVLESVIDAAALLAIVFPILYFFALRSMLSTQAHLEAGVRERTAEIESAKGELERSVDKLRAHEKEMLLLGEMGSFFQSCENLNEAMTVSEVQLAKLFPEMSGALFLINSSRNILERRAIWGDVAGIPEHFAPPDCWALRRSKPHMVEPAERALACSHMPVGEATWQICLPLAAQGEALGALCMVSKCSRSRGITNQPQLDQERMQFLVMASENLALAVASLRLNEKLSYQALRDPLTGLFNRRYLFDTLDRELDRASACGQTLSVVMFDIDHFKRFNDSFGHAAGDAVLARLGAILLEWIRGGDIAVRYGGEEFTIVLPDTPAEDAFARVESLRRSIEALAIEYEGRSLGRVTLSAGIATCPTHGGDRETLITSADEALYESKKRGRNRTTLASDLTTEASGRAAA